MESNLAASGKIRSNDTVQMAKGVAILLMVLGHTAVPGALHNFIYMFHMPLFLMTAGFCFKESHLADPRRFIKNRFKGLWWVFFKWNLIFLVLHNLFFALGLYDSAIDWSIKGVWPRLRDFVWMKRQEQLLGAMWFLAPLFVASLAGWCVIRIARARPLIAGAITLLLMGASMLLNAVLPEETNGIQPGNFLFYTCFFVTGWLLAKGWQRRRSLSRHLTATVALAGGIVTAVLCMLYPYGITYYFGWEMLPWTLGAVAGTIMTFALCSLIPGSRTRKLLIYCGDNTIQILVWHFVAMKAVTWALLASTGGDMSGMLSFPTHPDFAQWWPLYFAAGVALPVALTEVWRWLLRQKTSFSVSKEAQA